MMAGQIAALVRERKTAKDVIDDVSEADALCGLSPSSSRGPQRARRPQAAGAAE